MPIQQGPTPWASTVPGYASPTGPAPAGYEWDPVARSFRPIAGSPSDVLAQRARQQGIDDAARARAQSIQDQNMVAESAMRNRLMNMLDSTSSSDSSSSSSSTSGGGSGFGGGSVPFTYTDPGRSGSQPNLPPAVAPVTLPDNTAASAAAFARAKDKIGAQTAASVTALRSALSGRGMLGAGGERRGVTNILTAGQGSLGDTAREQAVSDVNRETDFAKMGYEGAITARGQDVTQRGQDIAANDSAASRSLAAATTAYSGGITQRGQDISEADATANRKLQSDLAARASRTSSVNTLLSRLY